MASQGAIERKRESYKSTRSDLPNVKSAPDAKVAARVDAALKAGTDPRDVERRFRGVVGAQFVRERARALGCFGTRRWRGL